MSFWVEAVAWYHRMFVANDALLLESALAAGHQDYPLLMPRRSLEMCNSPSSGGKHASSFQGSLMLGNGIDIEYTATVAVLR